MATDGKNRSPGRFGGARESGRTLLYTTQFDEFRSKLEERALSTADCASQACCEMRGSCRVLNNEEMGICVDVQAAVVPHMSVASCKKSDDMRRRGGAAVKEDAHPSTVNEDSAFPFAASVRVTTAAAPEEAI